MAARFENLSDALFASIVLGYEAEGDSPSFPFDRPDDAEIIWLADGLVSEGWRRSPNWPNDGS